MYFPETNIHDLNITTCKRAKKIYNNADTFFGTMIKI